jgi:hypothetical protein
MPDKRRHRGPHPADPELFAADRHETLRQAVGDLSWLLTRGYAQTAGLKLVGDRFRLTERQRTAVSRSACSDRSLARRGAHRLEAGQVGGSDLEIDGFNLLTTVEAALAGGVLLIGRDGCLRDLASMHGSYRKVEESLLALALIGQCLTDLHAGSCRWLFDRPVSNSGRIARVAEDLARQSGWPWRSELCVSPDAVLRESRQVVVSADSAILDDCQRWFNLADWVVRRSVPQGWIVDLR